MTVVESSQRMRAASLGKLREAGRLVVALNGQTVCLLLEGDAVHAVDNRCPHMGFPLHRGTVSDGILTCHWHHARFDLCSGGTFDQWADDLRRFPVEVEGDDVFVDLTPLHDPLGHQRQRLYDGLRLDIPLVLAKATIALLESQPDGVEVFASGLEFGSLRRGGGWFRGLTTLSCMMNLVPRLEGVERGAALYHGLADVAGDSADMPPRFPLDP
jgi:nitrite reductase/ring-hydroxylating ferredoxin subunit